MLFQRFFNGFFALLLKCSCFLLLPWGCVLLHSSTRFFTSEAYVFWSFAKFQKAQLVSSLHVTIFRNHLSDLSDLWFSKHGLCLDTGEDPLRDCPGRCIAAGSTLKRCHGQGVIWEFGKFWLSLVNFPSYAICWVWQVLLWSFRSIRVLCMLGFGV